MWQEHRYRHFSFELSSEVRDGWERTTGRLAYPAVVDLRRAHNLTLPIERRWLFLPPRFWAGPGTCPEQQNAVAVPP